MWMSVLISFFSFFMWISVFMCLFMFFLKKKYLPVLFFHFFFSFFGFWFSFFVAFTFSLYRQLFFGFHFFICMFMLSTMFILSFGFWICVSCSLCPNVALFCRVMLSCVFFLSVFTVAFKLFLLQNYHSMFPRHFGWGAKQALLINKMHAMKPHENPNEHLNENPFWQWTKPLFLWNKCKWKWTKMKKQLYIKPWFPV